MSGVKGVCRNCGEPTFIVNGEKVHGSQADWKYCCKRSKGTVAE